MRIFKYEIPAASSFSINMPLGAKILSLQTQNGTPMMWAMVDPDAPEATRRFEVRGTGSEVGEVGAFIGTFQLGDGALVLHVFEGVTP